MKRVIASFIVSLVTLTLLIEMSVALAIPIAVAWRPLTFAVEPEKLVAEADLNPAQVRCLARNLYHEARGDGFTGMLAVANVTVNRARDYRWPASICEVVFQENQFSWTTVDANKAETESSSWMQAQMIAKAVLRGELPDITKGSVFFHSITVKPVWRKELQHVARIGNHIFYR